MIKKDLGIIAAIILLIGLINFGNSNKENKDFVPDNFQATVAYHDVIPLGKWQKIHMLIIKDVDSNQIQSGRTSMTGVECGIHWEEQEMKLFVVENGIKYRLVGYKQLYKYHTPQFIMMYDINTFCGLSCYIPLASRPDLTAYYKTLKWYQDAGLNLLF